MLFVHSSSREGINREKKIINDYFQLMFWEDVWEEIKQSLMVYPPLTGVFLASTNVLVLPKLFKSDGANICSLFAKGGHIHWHLR